MLITAIATVFLHVLDADSVRRLHVRRSSSSDTSAATFATSIRVVDSELAARLARGLYWILPNLAQFDVKDRVVHGLAVPFGYMTLTFAYAASLHRDVAVAQHVDLFAAGFQVRAITKPRSVTKRTHKRAPISCSCVCA